jgi:predicted Zn-dependent peptidase
VLGVRTDFRASEDEHLNLMLHESCEVIFQPAFNENLEELVQSIIERLETPKENP